MADPFFRKKQKTLYLVFFSALVVQVLFSSFIRPLRPLYESVPPVPTLRSATIQFLGDREFAYRHIGIMIQNFGDTGGAHTPLGDYDFEKLTKWFLLENELDEKSDYMPFLAAYVFGGSQDVSKLPPLIDYLEYVGNSNEAEKWRWMVQAMYLARFKMHDNERGLDLAYKLSALYRPGLPGWVKQMPSFIKLDMGEKEAAYTFMVEVLKESAEDMHPNEVNFMIDYICNRVLDKQEALTDPLCIESD